MIAIVDGHPANRATATKAFVAAHADRLAVHAMPGYSPMFNPAEWVWKNLKHDVVGKFAATTVAAMKAAINAAAARLKAAPDIVRGFFGDPDLAYITAANQHVNAKPDPKIPA